MENKEMNKNAPVELDDETLSAVSGGLLTVRIQSPLITEEAKRRAQDSNAHNNNQNPY